MKCAASRRAVQPTERAEARVPRDARGVVHSAPRARRGTAAPPSAAATSSASASASTGVAPSYVTPAARRALFKPATEQVSGRSELPSPAHAPCCARLPLTGLARAPPSPPACSSPRWRRRSAAPSPPGWTARCSLTVGWGEAGCRRAAAARLEHACCQGPRLAGPGLRLAQRAFSHAAPARLQAAATTAACCICSTATPW
jgi:hypothetical protein